MTEGNRMKAYTLYSEEINGPVHFCGMDEEVNFKINENDIDGAIMSALGKEHMCSLFRGADIKNLKLILKYGIDSERPNQGFWGNRSLSKCLEYGEIILCYENIKGKESWKQYDLSSLSEDELKALKETYISYEVSRDKTKIFFSMFPDDRRGEVHYEKSHGYYIPNTENQKECLQALVLLGSGENWFPNLIAKFQDTGGTLKKDSKELIDIGGVEEISRAKS